MKPNSKTDKKIAYFFPFVHSFCSGPNQGSIRIDTIISLSVDHSITKENVRRAVTIYLPPDYGNTGKRYPALYLLHEIRDNNMDFTDDSLKNYSSVQELMDKGIATHTLKEMIIVMPDEKTNFYGSFYTNSTSIGNWQDFTVKELVGFIDSNYRTIAKSSARAIAGHSMAVMAPFCWRCYILTFLVFVME